MKVRLRSEPGLAERARAPMPQWLKIMQHFQHCIDSLHREDCWKPRQTSLRAESFGSALARVDSPAPTRVSWKLEYVGILCLRMLGMIQNVWEYGNIRFNIL